MYAPERMIIISNGTYTKCIIAGFICHLYHYTLESDSVYSKIDLIGIFMYGICPRNLSFYGPLFKGAGLWLIDFTIG